MFKCFRDSVYVCGSRRWTEEAYIDKRYVWVFVAVVAGKGGKMKNSIFWNLEWLGEFPSGIVRVFPNS